MCEGSRFFLLFSRRCLAICLSVWFDWLGRRGRWRGSRRRRLVRSIRGLDRCSRRQGASSRSPGVAHNTSTPDEHLTWSRWSPVTWRLATNTDRPDRWWPPSSRDRIAQHEAQRLARWQFQRPGAAHPHPVVPLEADQVSHLNN